MVKAISNALVIGNLNVGDISINVSEKLSNNNGIKTATGLLKCLIVDFIIMKSHQRESRIKVLWMINLIIIPSKTAAKAIIRFLKNKGIG